MKKISTVIFAVICVVITLLSLIFFKPKINNANTTENRVILNLWHIDSFEGGTGSRATFLKNVGNEYTAKNKNTLISVALLTVEGANKLIESGTYPDMISYGACGLNIASRVNKLDGFDVLDGGIMYKKRVAVSWCRGSYFHIKRGNGKNAFISENVYNSSVVATALNNFSFTNYEVVDVSTAYRNFISQKNSEMIGTQRDVIKLINANVEFTATPLHSFNDLFQYISVTTANENRAVKCKSFIKYLLSEDTQKKLTQIKMFSPIYSGLYTDIESFKKAENVACEYTVYCLATNEEIDKIKRAGLESLKNQDTASIIKLVKRL